jgi:SAM-dependent methyltransferase
MLDAARRASRAGGAPSLAIADAIHLPFADRSFDGVVVFRFLHHLSPDLARQVVREAARVADDFVVVSFFHPWSLHHWTRRVRELVSGTPRRRHAIRTAVVNEWLAAVGFRLERVVAQPPALRDLRVAAFRRRE